MKVFLVIGAKGIYNGSTLNTACQEISLLENGNSFRWGSSPALLERVFLERVETFLGYVVLVKQQDCQENFSAFEGMCLSVRLYDNLILCRAVFKPVFGFCWRKTAGKKYNKCCQYLSCYSKTTLEELESNNFLLKILYIEAHFSASFQGNICHFHLV